MPPREARSDISRKQTHCEHNRAQTKMPTNKRHTLTPAGKTNVVAIALGSRSLSLRACMKLWDAGVLFHPSPGVQGVDVASNACGRTKKGPSTAKSTPLRRSLHRSTSSKLPYNSSCSPASPPMKNTRSKTSTTKSTDEGDENCLVVRHLRLLLQHLCVQVAGTQGDKKVRRKLPKRPPTQALGHLSPLGGNGLAKTDCEARTYRRGAVVGLQWATWHSR